jgi:hypothetical protein
VEFVVDKVALGRVFSEFFGFPCQSSFHQLLHNHPHLSSGVGTTGQKWPQYKGLSLTPLAIKKRNSELYRFVILKDYRCETGIFMEGLRKSKKNLIQDRQCSGPNSNPAPPEQKSEALPTEPPCSSPHFIN